MPISFSGYGNLVIVDHGTRSYSLYGHLGSVAVQKGDQVDDHAPSGWPAGTRPATRPSTLSFASTVSPWIPLQWLKR